MESCPNLEELKEILTNFIKRHNINNIYAEAEETACEDKDVRITIEY